MIASHRAVAASLIPLILFPMAGALAQIPQPSFSDVPTSHPVYEAVEYLKGKGIIAGYGDGTFRPGKKVNRAEAVKIIVAPLITAGELPKLAAATYGDVPIEAWFAPYVEVARTTMGIIDGPPKAAMFFGERPVKNAEFLKMLLLARRLDPVGAFGEIRLPLALDVTNPEEWYYPHVRFALTASMIMVAPDGRLSPGNELTRADVALLLHRLLMYREGRRTQALLTEAETEIANILDSLGKNDRTNAELASARALLAARGAHASRPDVPLAQAALKVTESFRNLVTAYGAGVDRRFDEVVARAGDAWQLAARARELHGQLATITDRVQVIAKDMADSARSLKAQVSQ